MICMNRLIMEKNRDALESISKSLFTASEAIREALDTMDLKSVEIGHYQAYLDGTHRVLEEMAQHLQKLARS